MKTSQSDLIIEDTTDEAYGIVQEFFGSMRADQVYYSLTHPQY